MRKVLIVAAAIVVFVVALGASGYLWVRAAYVLPTASCGTVYPGGGLDSQTRLVTGAPRAPRCFLAAARTCKDAGIHAHVQGTESGTDYVFIIGAGGTPGRCQVTEYRQDVSFLGPGCPGGTALADHGEITYAHRNISAAASGEVAEILGMLLPGDRAELACTIEPKPW